MLYSKKNYLLMALSALFILVGFILMSGGQSEDPTAFSPEIFSSRRIVVAPIVCLIGFPLQGFIKFFCHVLSFTGLLLFTLSAD